MCNLAGILRQSKDLDLMKIHLGWGSYGIKTFKWLCQFRISMKMTKFVIYVVGFNILKQ